MFSRKFIALALVSGLVFTGCAGFLEDDEGEDMGRILLRNRALNAEYNELLAQGEQQRKELQSLTAFAKQQQQTIQNLNKQLQEKQAQLDANSASIQQLQAQLDAEKVAKQQLEDQLASLTQQLAAANEQINALLGRLSSAEKESQTYLEMAQKLEGEIKKGTISLTESKGKLTLNVSDKILFDSGKVEIKKEGLEVLNRVAEVLTKVTDKEIRIEGHTDNVKISGKLKEKYPTNWELSTSRATNVARYLVEKGSIDPANLYAAGYAEYHPIAPNDTPESRARNRRIEITLLPKDADAPGQAQKTAE